MVVVVSFERMAMGEEEKVGGCAPARVESLRGLYVCCLVESTTERCEYDGLRDAYVAQGGAVLMTKRGSEPDARRGW